MPKLTKLAFGQVWGWGASGKVMLLYHLSGGDWFCLWLEYRGTKMTLMSGLYDDSSLRLTGWKLLSEEV